MRLLLQREGDAWNKQARRTKIHSAVIQCAAFALEMRMMGD